VVAEDPSGETSRGALGGGDTIVGKQDQRQSLQHDEDRTMRCHDPRLKK
jgi:hypothetical protein